MEHYFLLLLTTGLLFSCKPAAREHSEFNPATVQTEATQLLQSFFQDIAKEGLTAEFKYLDPSDEFFWVPPGYASAISDDSVSTVLNRTAPNFSSINYRWQSLKVQPLSDSHVIYTGRVVGKMINTAGIEFPVDMLETGVLIRREDSWKILCGQSRHMEIVE